MDYVGSSSPRTPKMFGDWLPGSRPELTTLPNAGKVEVEPSKLQRWSFTKLDGKQSNPTTSKPPSLDILRSAYLLVIKDHGDKPDILRLNPPRKLERPDIRRTGLPWTSFGDDIRDAIWETLRFAFTQPVGFQWVLHGAIMLDPGPSLLTRGLIRLVPRLEYKKVDNDSYIVVFVSANSKQYKTSGFGQVDIADHDMPAGLPVPADAISGPYSLQDRRRERQPETAIPLRERRYTPAYTFEQDAIYSRHYTGPPAFAPLGYGPPADRIPRDRMPVDRIPVNQMPADRMPADLMPMDRMPERMPLDRMQDDCMPVDQMPSYRFPRRRYSPSPPNNPDRRYQQRVPRPGDGDSPGRNGYPPLSEDKHASAPHARMSAPMSSYTRRRALPYSEQPPPVGSSGVQSSALFDQTYYPPLPGSNQFWSELDSSDGPGDAPRRDRRYHRDARRRPSSLRSDDAESRDESDDSLDDDELYDQLLRKFTGHGLRERETANRNTDGVVNGGTNAEIDGNADEDEIGHVSARVEIEDADKAGDGDADGKVIDRDDKSDGENQDLCR